jgi:ATP-dependent DNA helicase RecG
MPYYDLTGGKVKVTITGKVLNIEYARLLAKNKELTLDEIILLDKVQKKQLLNDFEERQLKAKKLIEGRKSNYFISIKVAQKTGLKAAYSKNKAFDKSYYLDLIEKSIKEHGSIGRNDVDDLLWKKLPEWMNEGQKKIKINNLLSEMRRKDRIRNEGTFSRPKWVLKKRK